MTRAVARPRRNQQSEPSVPDVATPGPLTPPTAQPAGGERSAPAPTPRPHPHELWLEAGGGTAEYDPDRFVGLLRDHGYAMERKPMTAICFDVLGRLAGEQGIPWDDAEVDDYAAPLAHLLVDELGKQGYRIHDVARCVRPGGDPLSIGRPMTPEEEAALLPTAASPRPRRRRS